MDSEDSKRLLMDLMVRDNMSGAESRELVGKAIKMISDWKNDLIPPEKAVETLTDPEDMLFATLYEAYERNLRAYNAVDFDDLIVLPTKILQENAQVRDKWQNRIRYLLVDEYQDTPTPPNTRWLNALSGCRLALPWWVMTTSRFMRGGAPKAWKIWRCYQLGFPQIKSGKAWAKLPFD